MHNCVTSHLWLKFALHASSHPCMCTCVLRLGCFLFISPVLYFVPPFSFQPFLMFTSEFNERSRSNPLCDFRLGTVATSDHETPLTQHQHHYTHTPTTPKKEEEKKKKKKREKERKREKKERRKREEREKRRREENERRTKGQREREKKKKKEKNRLQLQPGPSGELFPITVTGVPPPEN